MATAESLVKQCDHLAELAKELEHLMTEDSSLSLIGLVLRVTPVVTQASSLRSDSQADLFLPLPPALLRAFQELPGQFDFLSSKGSLDLAEKLGRAATVYPDGFFYLTRGVLLVKNDTPANWLKAEEAFRQAATAPSVFPMRRAALFGTVAAEWVLAREGPVASRQDNKRGALANMHQLLKLAPLPAEMNMLTTMALTLGEAKLANRIVEDWEKEKSDDPRLHRQRLLVAFHLGEDARFLRLLEAQLKREPGQAKEWEAMRGKVVARSRKQRDKYSKDKHSAPRP
jgi:hypothetical protein